jgi:hypothetical protein
MIESNVPLPPIDYRGGRTSKYPFSQMKIGESLIIEGKPAIHYWQQQTGFRFAVRHVVEDGEPRTRCWRVA